MNIRSHTLILSLAGLAVLVSGCVNPDGTQNNTGTGAIVGGAFGALAGAALGGRSHGGTDALIGAAAGALAGSLIGNSADQQQAAMINDQQPVTYEQAVTLPPPLPPPPVSQPAPMNQPAPAPQPMSVADVEVLAKSGVSEDVMIAQIKNSQTVFHLDAGQVVDLRDEGVPASVVNYMINTPATVSAIAPSTPDPSASNQPTPPSTATTVADTTPNLVWVAGEWVWNDSGWVWVNGHWGLPPHPGAVWIAGRSWKDDHGWHNERGHWQ